MSKRIQLSIVTLLLCMTLLYPVSGQDSEIMLYSADLSLITADGAVNQDEYPQSIAIWNFKNEFVMAELSWAHNNTHLSVGIVAKLTGFIAFGMNDETYQSNAMTGANMIIASVDSDGVFSIGDYHSTGQVPPQIDDDQYESLQFAKGQESNGETVVEFTIPLTSDDTDDISWQVNSQYSFFVAGSESSDTLSYHENYHTSPYIFTITGDSIGAEDNLITLLGITAETEIPWDEVFYVLLFFVVIIFFMRRNRVTARY
ncbi:MAG: hypothetical protein GPJ54_17665 [Candidatus Heimdallarchaeota archaeon]|nr:hypothetical protein [Candidatus Heimdallarchaeota archaeon]